MPKHESIHYLELPATDLEASKAFFSAVFSWQFTDYGVDYSAFHEGGFEGGFYRSEQCSRTANGACLLVFYSADLAATQAKIEAHGGKIIQAVFDFPGGRRFHFCEPSGNEFGVWTQR